MKATWIEHRKHRILVCDYTQCRDEEEMIRLLLIIEAELSTVETPVHLLIDHSMSLITSAFIADARRVAREHGAKIGKSAYLGIHGIKAILLKSFIAVTGLTDSRVFENRQDALLWLSS